MNRKTIISIVVVVILIAGGIFAVKRARKKDASTPVAKKYAIVVSTFKPQIKPVTLSLPYLAIAKNDKDVTLTSRISARVDYIKASGSKVKKGDVIAKLDDTSIRSNINSVKSGIEAAKVALKNLEATHKRTLDLIAVKGASIEQSEMEESNIAALQSKIETLNQNLSELNNALTYAVILSPVDGRLSKTWVNAGDVSMPGRPIASLNAKNGFYLLVRVPTDLNIYGVRYNQKQYNAIKLNSTFNSLAEYKVYVDAPGLMSGDRVEVNVEVFKGDGLMLPFDAILNRNGKSYVLVKEGDKAVVQEVSLIQSGEEGAVVANAQLEGKELVVAKQDILLKLLGGISIQVNKD